MARTLGSEKGLEDGVADCVFWGSEENFFSFAKLDFTELAKKICLRYCMLLCYHRFASDKSARNIHAR